MDRCELRLRQVAGAEQTIAARDGVDEAARAYVDEEGWDVDLGATLRLVRLAAAFRADALGRGARFALALLGQREVEERDEDDVAAHEVRWQPQLGKRDAVSGHARFSVEAGSTRMEYALEQGDGRTEAERALGSLDVLVASFASWMAKR